MKRILFSLLMAVLCLPIGATETTIWTGAHNCGNWNGNQDLAWGGYNWSQVPAGATLRVYFTEDEAQTYWQLTLGVAGDGWKAINPNTDCVALEEGQTVFSILLSEADVTRLATLNGLTFNGANITVTSITLDAEEPTTDEIDLTQPMTTGWDATYDPTTQTLTMNAAWAGMGWWYGDDSEGGSSSKDCTSYSNFTLEFAEQTTVGGGVEISYVEGEENGWAGFEAGASSVTINFDAARAAHVKQIVVKLSEVGSVKLSRAYFTRLATAIITTSAARRPVAADAVKCVENGRLVIKTQRAKYNALGQTLD